MTPKILVIDDDEGDCYLVEDILSEDGIKVDIAVGGEMGIRLLSDKEYPVVITDLRMPDIDGMAIIDFIRKRHMNTLIVPPLTASLSHCGQVRTIIS